MSCSCNKCGFSACKCVGIAIGIIFGILFAIAGSLGFLVNLEIIAFTVLALAFIVLILAVIAYYIAASSGQGIVADCVCENGLCLFAGALGTILSILFLIIADIPLFSIASLVFLAIAAFFFALMIVALIAFVYCLICRTCGHRQ